MTELDIDYEEDAFWEECAREEKEQEDKDAVVLGEVRKIVDDDYYEQLLSCMEESNNANFEISDTPIGERNGYFYKEYKEYLIQNSVGESGDSWCGVVSVELPNGKYFIFSFDC